MALNVPPLDFEAPAEEPPAVKPGQARIALDEWRVNWRSGFGTMIGLGLGSSIVNSVFSLFILPLHQAFGWSRSEIAFAFSASFGNALLAPFLGRLVDKVGVRKPLLAGIVAMTLCYIGFSAMPGSLPVYYILFASLTWLGLITTGLTYSRVIAHAFPRSRGFSLALARSGMAIANTFLPILLFFTISNLGWRSGYVLMALLTGGITLPIVYFWIERDRGRAARPPAPKGVARPWLSLVKDRKVILSCLAAGFGFAPGFSMQTQLLPLLTDRGLEPQMAAILVGGVGAASFTGGLVTGVLLDRYWAPLIALIVTIGSATGALLILPESATVPMLIAGVLLVGLGLGAEIDLTAYIVARYFGMGSFSSIYGMISFTMSVTVPLWAMFYGYSFDAFGGYQMALGAAAAAFLLSGIFYLSLGRYPDQSD